MGYRGLCLQIPVSVLGKIFILIPIQSHETPQSNTVFAQINKMKKYLLIRLYVHQITSLERNHVRYACMVNMDYNTFSDAEMLRHG